MMEIPQVGMTVKLKGLGFKFFAYTRPSFLRSLPVDRNGLFNNAWYISNVRGDFVEITHCDNTNLKTRVTSNMLSTGKNIVPDPKLKYGQQNVPMAISKKIYEQKYNQGQNIDL